MFVVCLFVIMQKTSQLSGRMGPGSRENPLHFGADPEISVFDIVNISTNFPWNTARIRNIYGTDIFELAQFCAA